MKPGAWIPDVKNRQNLTDRTQRPAHRECLPLGDLADFLLDAYESITNRAYEKYLDRGAEPGGELDDWLSAERELLPEVPVDFSETGDFIYVLASVSGFTGADVSVAIEPCWLLIMARGGNAADEVRGEDLGPNECSSEAQPSGQMLSVFELSCEVDPSRSLAVLADGLLGIRMPKIPRD
jgi:HSP20 family molecular chaperone IbpA